MLDIKSLYEKLEGIKNDDLPANLKGTLATLKSRFKSKKDFNISLGSMCRLAKFANMNPTLALLSLVDHRLKEGRDSICRVGHDDHENASLANEVHTKLDELCKQLKQDKRSASSLKTLVNFPAAFDAERFYIVTGDRRETQKEKWITPADFGVVSSSPAELRYISRLGLPPQETDIITDKTFVLTPYDELCEKFSESTIICLGSPSTNALSRILNRYSIHRYNINKNHYNMIEELVQEAWRVGTNIQESESKIPDTDPKHDFFAKRFPGDNFNRDGLESFLRDKKQILSWIKNSTFSGGLIDPTYDYRIRGAKTPHDGDFGIITLAQNPFRKSNDGKYPAILISGCHLPGTYYALHPIIWNDRETFFEKHPLGGIIKVELISPSDQSKEYYLFHERMENFRVDWDKNSEYETSKLLSGLKEMSETDDQICQLTKEEAQRAYEFVNKLLRQV